jgi:hypothetical protein
MDILLSILLYGGGPKGPFAGGICLLFLGGVLVTKPEMVFKMKLLFDEPKDEAEGEKRISGVKRTGYIIVILGVIVLAFELYNYFQH